MKDEPWVFAVEDSGSLRYFHSHVKAENLAKKLGTEVLLAFNVPSYLMED